MNGGWGTRGRATALVGAMAAMALVAGMSAARDVAPVRAGTVATRAETPRPHWSVAEATLLVAEINAARADGLDPRDYGLAALKGEIELATEIRRGTGSRQLDTLADAAARALATDRLRKAGVPNLSSEVQAAESENGPAVWLGVLRA